MSVQLAYVPVSLPLAYSSGLKAVWASGFIPERYALDTKYGRMWSRRLRGEQKRPEVGTDSVYRACMISHLLYTLTVDSGQGSGSMRLFIDKSMKWAWLESPTQRLLLA